MDFINIRFVLIALLVTVLLPTCRSQAPNPDDGVGGEALLPIQEGDPEFEHRVESDCTSPYRTLDGTCTNPSFKVLGSAGLAQFSYALRRSSKYPSGKGLPSPRLISNIVSAQPGDILSRRGLNELTTFFGQFLDHCIVVTPESEDEMPIHIPEDDPIFGNFTKGELPFKRSVRAVVPGTSSVERPINTLSSAIDLTAVYGPDETRLRHMRTLKDGKMKTSKGDMLPLNEWGMVNGPTSANKFYLAGDHRANENPTLTALHTLFVREHNLLAEELKQIFPSFDDEKLFQYAKIVNTAQFQKIAFEEFYPIMTGKHLPLYTGFKPWMTPGISDIFAGAAFRVGHTMVSNKISRRAAKNKKLKDMSFNDMFFHSSKIMGDGMDVFLRGAMFERGQEVDIYVVDALRNFLFTNVPAVMGFDLIAMNLQRGRDHALPSYNELRWMFRMRPLTSFRRLTTNRATASALQTAYGSIDKVEAFLGLLAEDHVGGASMGRTMMRIWEKEFGRLRDGDWFYFRNEKAYPKDLLEKFDRVKQVLSEKETFKRLILRNTKITEEDLPHSIFKAHV